MFVQLHEYNPKLTDSFYILKTKSLNSLGMTQIRVVIRTTVEPRLTVCLGTRALTDNRKDG